MTSANSTSTSQDAGTVVIAGGREITIRKANEEEVVAFLTGELAERDEEPQEISRRMVEQVLSASSFEEAMEQSEVLSLKNDYLDKPFTILDVAWYKSSFEEGPPMFCVLTVADADGAQKRISTGALMPMTMIYKGQLSGTLSTVRVKAVQRERPTKAGFRPINLVKAD